TPQLRIVAERIGASAFEDPSYLPKLLVTLVKQGIDRVLRQLIEMLEKRGAQILRGRFMVLACAPSGSGITSPINSNSLRCTAVSFNASIASGASLRYFHR